MCKRRHLNAHFAALCALLRLLQQLLASAIRYLQHSTCEMAVIRRAKRNSTLLMHLALRQLRLQRLNLQLQARSLPKKRQLV
jgi:hypothetical protein